jgi:ABC-type bacteriocin/lantibiotic exporter with double-glycine peptidase domain
MQYYAGGILMWRAVDYFAWRIEANVNRDIAEEVLDHMLKQSVDFHANNFTGTLVSQTNKLLGGYIRLADTTMFQVYPMLSGIVLVTLILAHRVPLFVVLLFAFQYFILLRLLKFPLLCVSKAQKMPPQKANKPAFWPTLLLTWLQLKVFPRQVRKKAL